MKPFWMLNILVIIIVVLSGAGCTGPTTQSASTNQTIGGLTLPATTGPPTPEEARQIATAAYIYGYSLVVAGVVKDIQTAVPAPSGNGRAPINEITTASIPSTPETTTINLPTVDLLYTSAWLNLTEGPMVLTVPEANGRYYVAELIDGWQNAFASPGPRTTGNGSGSFAIAGPGWNGTLPANVTKLQSPTNTVLIAARVQQDGPADLASAVAFENGFTLTPLSAWGANYTPPTTVPVNPNVNTTADPFQQVANMTPASYFNRMATLMQGNPPSSADKPVTDQIARIGIVPGKLFDWNSTNATMQNAIMQGVQDGAAQVYAASVNLPGEVENNGWTASVNVGTYGTNYTLRAGVARAGSFASLPQDGLYSYSTANATGAPYSGANDYVVHFATNQLPPANAFWSLTMYNTEYFLIANPINRYAISPHLGNVTYNPDGSLDIYIQNASPSPDKESNWLPAPSGQFYLALRLYWPQEAALDGSWVPPPVQTVGPAATATSATVSAS